MEEEFQEQQQVSGGGGDINAQTLFAPPGTTMFGSYCSEIKPTSLVVGAKGM